MEMLSQFGSWLAGLMFFCTIYQHYLPPKSKDTGLPRVFKLPCIITHKLVNYFSPSLDITFHEYTNDRFNRSDAYNAIQNYLGDKSSVEAKSMNADYIQDGKSLLMKLGDNEEIMDVYQGVQLCWSFKKVDTSQPSFSFYPTSNEKRYTFINCFYFNFGLTY